MASGPPVKRLKQSLLCFTSSKSSSTGDNSDKGALKIDAFNEYDLTDVPHNGDCLFACLALGLHRNSAMDVRREVVDYLKQHPDMVENIPVTEQNRKCLSNNKNTPLMTNSSVDDYVAQMSLSGQWGDGIMLACASKKYERQINVLLEDSSLITFKPHEEESDDAEQQHQPLLCGFIRTAGSASPNHYVFLQRKKVEGNVCSTTPLVSSDVKEIGALSDIQVEGVENVGTSEVRSSASVDSTSVSVAENNVVSSSQGLTVSSSTDLPFNEPNQPRSVDTFPKQTVMGLKGKAKLLSFQCSWYDRYPWLHFSPDLNAILCFYCSTANRLSLLAVTTQNEPSFLTKGFTDWKHAMRSFSDHQQSACHKHAVSQLVQLRNAPSVDCQLSEQKKKEQAQARLMLHKQFTSIRYLVVQGLALRGHDSDDGNFLNLLRLRAGDCTECNMKAWLDRVTNFTSPVAQNEILELLSNAVIRNVVSQIKQESLYFGIIVDGTQDCTGKEQECICLRFIDKNLNVKEAFVGLYEPPNTTGKTLSLMIKDVLTRFDLRLDNLRAQTYDGAANMAGEYNGCQKLIRDDQPLAAFYHCAAHCTNLVAEHTAGCCPLLRDALLQVQELGNVHSRSMKFRQMYEGVKLESFTDQHIHTIKPLCPTRWLCRVSPVSHVLQNYAAVLSTLEAMADTNGETAAKCGCLLAQFRKGVTVLGLKIAVSVFSLLEQLNKSLQAKEATISGMIESVQMVTAELKRMRNEEGFSMIMTDISKLVELHDLDEIVLPRARRPPSRFCGQAEHHTPTTAEEHYRALYYLIIDTATVQLTSRFSTDGGITGLRTYMELENSLLAGEVTNICNDYPELRDSDNSLDIQLKMFRHQFQYQTLREAQQVMQSMRPEVRALFHQVEALVRLLLISPASSCSAERSFSCLRRLKTWLRSTMTQKRLNSVVVCHIHQEIVKSINIDQLAKEFAERSQTRRNMFGNY